MASDPRQTPAMRQYHRFKQQHPGCVLFFRMGDFYEMFDDDAQLAHKVLGVALTQRTEGVPMAGVPHHSVENYLRRMIQAGYRVAVCDQIEDAAQAKGVVERDVTRVVTPGTLTDEALLDEARENPLAAIVFHRDDHAALAWAELSTGDFHVAELDPAGARDELARLGATELLYCETATGEPPPRVAEFAQALGCALTPRPAWQMRPDEAADVLRRQFNVAQLAGFGFDDNEPALAPAGAIVHYLLETQATARAHDNPDAPPATATASANSKSEIRNPKSLPHLRPPRRFTRSAHLVIDQTSLRSLEVERTLRTASVEGSLLGVFRGCVTAMGKRRLRHWLCYPLACREPIEQRQRVVEALVHDSRFLDELRTALDNVQDVQRIAGRLAVRRALPRDLVALGTSAAQIAAIEHLLAERPSVATYHERAAALSESLQQLATRIGDACVDDPPAHLREGGLIRDGHDAQLDECRALQRDSHDWLARYQKQLIDDTGITAIKLGYNKVFGYYIELSAANRDKAPDAWTRKQTLKNAERFITAELKDYEQKVLSADARAVTREQALFAELCELARRHSDALHAFGELVAELDALACFARRAVRGRYVKPTIVDHPTLDIRAGRHPVLDEMLADREVVAV